MSSDVRVRFAPSPTGLLHIGGLRTALYNYLFARQQGGTLVLRIEDTDRSRYMEDAEKDILESLSWTGLDFDEGPLDAVGHASKITAEKSHSDTGAFGPYHQSERRDRYINYAQRLIEKGFAYYAFDTVEEIESMRDRLRTHDNPTPKYDPQTRMQMRNSLALPADECARLLNENADYVIRLKIPSNESIQFDDLVRGSVSFETSELDDQVLLKADGMPTYHLANVVDDHEMAISHVIRGEEWLSSTPKHLLLYRYLGWSRPAMAHLPLIMSPGGGKLSKRKAVEEGIPVNVKDYRVGHYEPEALLNFLVLLGWSPGDDRELLNLEEMVKAFSFEHVGKSGAVFDYNKLLWFNEHYMREKSDEELAGELIELIREQELYGMTGGGVSEGTTEETMDLPAGRTSGRDGPDNLQKSRIYDKSYMSGVARLLKERVSRLPDMLEAGRFFFEAPVEYDEKAVRKGWKEETPERILQYRDRIARLEEDTFRAAELKRILTDMIEEEGIGMGKLMMPLRVAVTGTGSGPDLFESLELLGRAEVVRRLSAAVEKLG
ncbi:MAG: glutamate--tRNA ligase [Balneolales bacterium]